MKIYDQSRKEPLRKYGLEALEGKIPSSEFDYTGQEDEIFVAQLLLVSDSASARVGVRTPSGVCCYNTEGVDKFGKKFTKELELRSDRVQPVFIGFDLAGVTAERRYTIEFYGDESAEIEVHIGIDGKAVNKGYNDLWRLSRLQWLNSALGLDERACFGYTPIGVDGNTLSFIGRELTLGGNGLPSGVTSFYDDGIYLRDEPQAALLAAPIVFDVGEEVVYGAPTVTESGDNAVIGAEGESESLTVTVSGKARYEGSIAYSITLRAKKDYSGEITLTVPFTEEASVYANGLGKKGGYLSDIDFKWNARHQDTLFVGGVNVGARVKFKAENYRRPLINIYYKNQPLVIPVTTWDNGGKGGITLKKTDGGAVLRAYTGEYTLKGGEARSFDLEIHMTPFRPIRYDRHYGVRYYHNNKMSDNVAKEVRAAEKNGLNAIVVHHGNMVHPFINYPFIETEKMRELVAAAHARNIGVKFYYTVREHSNHMAEVFAYKSLGDEIIMRKKGAGYAWHEGVSPWLTEYFGEEIIPAWRVIYRRGKYKNDHDVSFIVRPDSRLDNYYVEGLNWLVKEIGIDGIYIDDTALDRTTLERARKTLGDDRLIDMHMWNHEEERAGDVSCMNLYTEIFPFIDTLWIGEGYPYKSLGEDYILTEVSGIPYGLTSQMLESGGDPYLGMLYAMNNRYGWGVRTAGRIYGLWDDFGIADARVCGYWSKDACRTGDKDVKATAYVKADKTLLCLYNFSQETREVVLDIGDKLLPCDKATAQAVSPSIKGLQKRRSYDLNAPIKLGKRSGVIIEIAAK